MEGSPFAAVKSPPFSDTASSAISYSSVASVASVAVEGGADRRWMPVLLLIAFDAFALPLADLLPLAGSAVSVLLLLRFDRNTGVLSRFFGLWLALEPFSRRFAVLSASAAGFFLTTVPLSLAVLGWGPVRTFAPPANSSSLSTISTLRCFISGDRPFDTVARQAGESCSSSWLCECYPFNNPSLFLITPSI